MSALATPAFLAHLKSLYPAPAGGPLANPWYIPAAVAFGASNRPDAVPRVFAHVLQELAAPAERLLLARKLREAIFKSGLTCGYSRAINSLIALHEATPVELRDTQVLRDTSAPMATHEANGRALFRTIYGDTAPAVQGLLDAIHPDMGWFSNTIGYGLTYSFAAALTPRETSYTLVAALIALDTPRQIGWHLDGARRGGASVAEVRAVRQIAVEAAGAAGVVWRDGVPEVGEGALGAAPTEG